MSKNFLAPEAPSAQATEIALPYGAVEEAIARVLGIGAADRPALNARLRHIRSRGALPRPGSGRKIRYSYRQAFEMLATVTLEHGGFTPRLAMSAAQDIYGAAFEQSAEDIYALLAVDHTGEGQEARLVCGQILKSERELLKALARFRAGYFVNVSALEKDFKHALALE